MTITDSRQPWQKINIATARAALAMLVGGIAMAIGGSLSKPLPDKHVLLYAPSNIKSFTLGFDLIAADTLWLRVLQDFDVCDQTGLPELVPSERAPKARCNRGWVYSMIDAITELDTKFKIAHTAGAVILSIVVDDAEGAAKIYDKAIERFPLDWQIAYRASYHYLYEIKDEPRAANLLREAGKRGAPSWVFALAARIYTKQGKLELAQGVLKDAIGAEQNDEFKPYLEKRLKEIEQQNGP